jgi:hypothetical protein
MSHHVTVNCHTCGETLNHGHDSLPGGLGPLFDELGCPVVDWNGLAGVAVLPRLQSAIVQLIDDRDFGDLKRRHDTRMGIVGEWSYVDFALPFLEALRDAICRDPDATIHVS